MYFVEHQSDGTVAISLLGTIDDMSVDGETVLQPDELFFGRAAKQLRDGVYDLKGKLVEEIERAWDESKHPRVPAGSSEGGQFGHGGAPFGPAPTTTEAKQILKEAKLAAIKLGFDPNKVSIAKNPGRTKVDRLEWEIAGHYSPVSHHITLFPESMYLDTVAIMAHEVQHHKFEMTYDAYLDEMAKFNRDEPSPKFNKDGSLPEPLAQKYPIFSALRPFNTTLKSQLQKLDGVTPYSAGYWAKGAIRADAGIGTAVNETLSEIALLKYSGERKRIAPVWQDYYDTVNRIYAQLK